MAQKAEPLNPKQLALQLGTDARTVRKFLRSTRGLVGQGKRWQIEGTKKAIEKITKEFEEWKTTSTRPSTPETDEAEGPTKADALDALDEVDFEDLDEIEDLDLDLD